MLTKGSRSPTEKLQIMPRFSEPSDIACHLLGAGLVDLSSPGLTGLGVGPKWDKSTAASRFALDSRRCYHSNAL